MSGNQHREGRRSGRSGNSGHHRSGYSGGGGRGGGGGAAAPPAASGLSSHSGQPPLSSNRSFKKVGNVQSGPRTNVVSTISDASSGFAPATPPKGAASLNGSQSHFQPPSHEAPNAPPTTVSEKPANVPPPRYSSHPAPRGPPSQIPTKAPDSSIPPLPSRGDQPRGGFPLQFGSINVGMMNGLQIPARTSSAPPNLDEQKRNQALLDASKAMAHGPPPAGPKPQMSHPKKDPTATGHLNPVLPQSHQHPPTQPFPPQPKVPTQQVPPVPGPAPGQAPPQPRPLPNVIPMPSMPLPVPFQHQQAPQLQFGGHGSQMQTPQGVVPSSLQMTMTLPVGSAPPQVPQPMFVSGMQPHGLPQQALLHQSQGMGFVPSTGHQLGQPQLGGLGMGSLGPQYPPPQQSAAKFGSARKAPTVKITHPDTHEEVKLENVAAAPRSMPNMAAQSQPIPTFAPQMYYQVPPSSFNPAAMYFPGAANMPLSTQMPTGSQPPRYPYPVSQPSQPMTFMNQQSIINQAPSGKPVPTPTLHAHADSETVHPPGMARPTVTIAPPVKVEAPKQSRPLDKPADGSHQLKESNASMGTVSIAPQPSKSVSESKFKANTAPQVVSEKKAPLEMPPAPAAESRPGSAGAEMKKKDTLKRMDSVKEQQRKPYKKEDKKELEQPQSDVSHTAEVPKQTTLAKEGDSANNKAAVVKSEPTLSSLETETAQTENKGDLSESCTVATVPDVSDAKESQSETGKVQLEQTMVKAESEKEKLSGEPLSELIEKSHGEPSVIGQEAPKPSEDLSKPAEDNSEEKEIRPTSSTSSVSTDIESLSSSSFSHTNGSTLNSPAELVSSEVVTEEKALRQENKFVEGHSLPREKPVAEAPRKTSSKKKLRKEVLSKADAAGSSELYSAYKGREEKPEANTEITDISIADGGVLTTEEANKGVKASEEEASGKGELDDWEDVADLSTPKLPLLEQKAQKTATDVTGKKRYSRDFLLTFCQQFTALPAGFQAEPGMDALFGGNFGGRSFDQPYPSPGRGQRGDRRMGGGGGPPEEERWIKSPGPYSPARDMRMDMGQFNNGPPNLMNLRPGQGPNYGVLKYPRGQPPNQFVGGILSQPMPQGGGLHRSGSDMDRWQHVSGGIQRGLIPSPVATPHQIMHRADNKYEVGKISDEEQAKQRQLKGILNKLTPQNFDKLFEQVKAVNIDNPVTLAGVISQIFDKALMEPTFCEMYANFCSHLATALPNFGEDNEKITFKRLLLNKCQEEFERGEREEAEADKTEEEGEVKQTKEEREEKRVKARRRMLGNIRLIGELYKKRMLTERIMHECIKKLLGPSQNPDEEDIEALCKLMSTIGEMIDHPKAKEHMDAYFDIMAKLSTNQRYSSRVRFMLKDALDLRRNKWQQRRKVEGPKKIEEVHRDAAQERQAQSTRLARGGPVMNNPPMRRGPQMGLVSPVSQHSSIRGMAMPQSGRSGHGMQDVRFDDRDRHQFDNRNMNTSLPLPQRVNRDESITLGPQGGLGRGMSVRGQPAISNASSAMGDRLVSGPTNGFGSGTSSDWSGYGSREGGTGMRLASPEERTGPPLGWGHRGLDRNFSAGSRPVPPVGNQQAGLVASSPGGTSHVGLPDSVIKEKSVSAIREFYSAKDEKEVTMCIEELNSPGSYHLIISTWVSDSFERKETERDFLYKLLVNLCKPNSGLFSQAQLHRGLETVLSTLEDAVNDAPKAPEFLGRLFAKFIAEDVTSLKEIGRLVLEGGEEPGMLIEAGLGGDVIGCTLEYIKAEKGDSFLNEVRAGSNLRLEDFKPPAPMRSKKLDPFI